MKGKIAAFLLFLSVCPSAFAQGSAINSINIDINIGKDGSADVCEVWNVRAERGSEWYLVKDNLGDIDISGFCVSENGRSFNVSDSWNIDGTLEDKAFRCGMVRKKNGGIELCWGLGNYGNHIFTVNYTMGNAVKSLSDYDMFHMQLVSPGMSATPENVSVTISAPESLSQDNSGVWGFGYEGTVGFGENGSVILESTGPVQSVIALIRFDKGIFTSESVQNREFGEVLEAALEGSSFRDDSDGDDFWSFILSVVSGLFVVVFIAVKAESLRRRRILGCRPKEIGWCRELPFGGDILQTNYTLGRLYGEKSSDIAAAMVLKMIMDGQILIQKSGKKNVDLCFNDSVSYDSLSSSGKELLEMMREASGKDRILQKNEFKRWSASHGDRLREWIRHLALESSGRGQASGNLSGTRYTEQGQAEARKVLGFRKYLKEFTLLNERKSAEVALWRDYLVFAALFGIAEKVAKELSEINPDAFEKVLECDYPTVYHTINLSRVMADSITDSRFSTSSGSSRGGFGGFSSLGGGGGFSGGGFGGGVR